ncbi:unnamed protein product [Mytilus edulis]|uniref:ISXO2-like transposase domain-containing protein n=1 Tax=Mytilus edulis TaxID=6550 RepID=A0A8S3VLP6_MYTED|nr:unnamed protein product [Mytilus edulis]
MSLEGRKNQSAGNYRCRKTEGEIRVFDFSNPWNFYSLFMRTDIELNEWLREENFLLSSYDCSKCEKVCRIGVSKDKLGGQTFRCTANKNHEYSIYTNSFFAGCHADIRDVFQFIRSYLQKNTLRLCSISSGIAYKSTAVYWAQDVREVFVQFVWDNMFSLKFTGEVELDESLFGRKCKYHKGKDSGTKVWVFGIIEKSSNRIVLYPVDKRSREVLLPLIKRHVEAGSTIFSDGWAAYLTLNQEGYRHFAVSHASTFKQNPGSGLMLTQTQLKEHGSIAKTILSYKHPILKDTFNMDDGEKVLRMSDVSDHDNNENLDPMTVEEVAEDAGEKEEDRDRVKISAFEYVNGLGPWTFNEWVNFKDLGRNDAAYRHFDNLLKLFESRHYKLYAYHVENNRYEYIDGTVHFYTHKSKRWYLMTMKEDRQRRDLDEAYIINLCDLKCSSLSISFTE